MLSILKVNSLVGILSLLVFCSPVYSGATFNCESTQSGEWREHTTWSGCDGDFPNSTDDAVVISSGHVVNINNSIQIHSLYMQVDSELIGESMIFDVDASDFDSSIGKISYEGRFYVTNNGGNVILGAVNGTNDIDGIKLESSSDIILTNVAEAIDVKRLRAFSSLPSGKIIINNDINTSFTQDYNIPVEIGDSVVLSGFEIEMDKGLSYGNHSLEVNVQFLASGSVISGVITSGPLSELIISGEGRLILDGLSSTQGVIHLNDGELFFNGIHNGEVILNSDSLLRGAGTINGSLTMNETSLLYPGINFVGLTYGVFQVSELLLNQDSGLNFLIGGDSTGADYDQIQVDSNVQLDGHIQVFMNYQYDYGDVIILIDNQGNNPVNGIFQGFNEGDVITENFQISYQGGDGNDVTITSICGENITVTNNLDNGPGSFREAIANVCAGGEIDFEDSYLITVDSTIEINNAFLQINGSGQTFQSSGNHSIINNVDDSNLSFFDVSFQNTTTLNGAITNHGSLGIYNAYFQHNNNISPTGGGAITNYGGMSIQNVSFFQNNASQGGAIHNQGAFYLLNSTLYQNGNNKTVEGGAIYNNKQLTLINVTIVDSGDGSVVAGNSIFTTLEATFFRMQNTVIDNSNASLSECIGSLDNIFGFESVFVSDGSCEAGLSGDPMMGTWGSYGGFAPTIPLLPNSILINTGIPQYCNEYPLNNGSDQVGNPRTYGIDCDIGAVEFIDETAPEVLVIKESERPIDVCGDLSKETSQFDVIFNEPVLNAEDMGNYQLLHAGDDQSFLTSDDVVIQLVSVISDQMRPTPTVTMTTAETVPNGLLRLQIDSDITDEFYLDLYDGDGYQHPFRVDIGNYYVGGHFDDCVEQDPLAPWSINTINAVTLGSDKDNSNVSLSLLAEVSDNDDLIVNQCVNLDDVTALSMSVFIKDSPIVAVENKIGENKQGQSFNLMMSCNLFDDENCFGNQLDVIETQNTNLNSSLEWQAIEFDLGLIDVVTKSGSCGLALFANQASASQVQLDALRLVVVSDLIYSHGFESLSD